MWFLQNTANAGLRFSIPTGKELIIGRKNCDLQIEGDQSISRKHATLHVATSERDSIVTLTDNGSKFGSFVDGRRLSANQKVELSTNSELKFGQGPSTGTFKLVYEPLVFCCSSMAGPEKQRVKQLARTLGGRVVNSWSSECTHLVMNNLNVTIKVVSALSSCRSVISPSWLETASRCFHEGKALPSAADYQPDVVDTNLLEGGEVSFRPNFRRRTLFQDRTLYFLCDKQFSTLHQCVESAGARCVDCSRPSSVDLETLTAKESVVLGLDQDTLRQLPQEHREWVEKVNNFLDSRDLRTVHESEIGFALLYISIEKHCNPRSREGVPEEPTALPHPTLSQMQPPTQYTQDHPLPVPPSQASPHPPYCSTPSQPSSSVTSILAPDSQVPSPNSAQSMPKHSAQGASEESGTSLATSDVAVKINETVMHGAKSSHQAVLASGGQHGAPVKRKRGPASSNGGSPKLKQPKLLDCLFDDDDELSPIQATGRSKGGDGHHGLVTSTQAAPPPPAAARDRKETVNLKTKDDNDPPASTVDDSQPDLDLQGMGKDALDTSKLPGLKTILSHDRPSMSLVIDAKGQAPVVAKEKSIKSQMSGSQDASVLAPSSLTPSSQRRKVSAGDNGMNSQLPNSGLLSELFQSKRKRRGDNIIMLADDDEVVCIDNKEREREGGREEGPPAKKKLKKAKISNGDDAKNSSDMTVRASYGGGNNTKAQNAEVEAVQKSNSRSMLASSPARKNSESEMITSAHSTNKSVDKVSYRDRFSRPLDPIEEMPQVNSSRQKDTADTADTNVTKQKKTPKKSPSSSTSPFLSTRKQRRKSTLLEDDNHPGEANRAMGGEAASKSAAKSLFLETQSSQYTATAMVTPATGTQTAASGGEKKSKHLTTPFTFLTTEASRKAAETVTKDDRAGTGGAASVGGHIKMDTPFTVGRRAKVTTAADALWEEEESEAMIGEGRGFDGENPLGTQVDEEVSSQTGVFRPVLTEDGFIVARKEPTRLVSRFGRFALHTKRELFSQPEVQVEIVKTRLVVRPLGERRESGCNYDNGVTGSGLKNFKKFRKTLNTNASAGIPRFINLTVYCPRDDHTLPDWDVSEAAGAEEPAASLHSDEEDDERMEKEEDDIFDFARPVVIKRRRR